MRGTPGRTHTFPFMRTTGTQYSRVGKITSAFSGKSAMRCRARVTSSGTSALPRRCAVLICMRRIVSWSYVSATPPKAFASDSYVMSSGVGPIPPLVTTQSCVRDRRCAASAIVSASSGITSVRRSSMPSSKQSFASLLLLVSSVLPLSTSSPMIRQAAVRTNAPRELTCSGGVGSKSGGSASLEDMRTGRA